VSNSHIKMKLQLHNFQQYSDHTFDIPDNIITLLQGPSGVGKTTILEALIFVFHDQMKSRCYHFDNKDKGQIWVKLTSTDFIIYRQRRTNLLQVIVLDHEFKEARKLQDDEAQGWINHRFGSSSLFLTCTYLKQKQDWTFFQLSNGDKVKVLYELVGYKPDLTEQYMIKLQNEVQTTNKQLDQLNNQIIQQKLLKESHQDPDALCLGLNLIKKHKLTELHHIPQVIQWYDQQINIIQSHIDKYNKIEQQRDQNKTISKQIDDLTIQYNNITITEDTDELRIQLQQLEQQYNNHKLYLEYHDLLKQKQTITITSDQVQVYQTKYKTLQKWNWTAKTTEVIVADLNKYEQIMTYFQVVDEWNRYNKQLNEYKTYQTKSQQYISILTEFDLNGTDLDFNALIKVQTNLLHEYKLSLNKQHCPHCGGSVIIQSGNIVKVNDAHISDPTEQLNKLIYLADIQSKYKYLTPVLEPTISDEIKNVISTTAIYQPEQYRSKMSSITDLLRDKSILLCETITTEQMLLYETQQDISAKLSKYEMLSLSATPVDVQDITKLKNKIAQLDNLIKKKLSIADQIDILKKNIINTEAELQYDIVQLKNTLSNLRTEQLDIVQLNYRVSKHLQSEVYEQNIFRLNGEINLMQTKLQQYQLIKEAITQAEQTVLNTIVLRLNKKINSYVSQLFDEHIEVNISASRELKNGVIKPEIDIKIWWKESLCSDIMELSGGQVDRIQIAMMLAVNVCKDHPYIVIDEKLAYLDNTAKENIIDLLNKIVAKRKKTVLVVDHNTIEGFYQNVMAI
jgi:energy-coupling factor transporter ATP-binding protein EcfA2